MQNSHIPQVHGLDRLTPDQLDRFMTIYEGQDQKAAVERRLRDVFLYAAVNGCSDVHLVARGDRQKPEVTITVRTTQGTLIHEVYTGEHGKAFENKLFQVCGVPQGASTPSIVSTRFDLRLPLDFALAHGRKARDGKVEYEVDVRLEYARTHDGFCFITRLLDQESSPALDEMGFTGALLDTLLRALRQPSGMILVTGPTGSGKTTLLKACIDFLNDGTRAISTVEDPVELKYRSGSVKQMQVGGEITFARALRSMLRQDPDVVMVGEIRDRETMEIAIQAAQTGHLLLATLHTNSAHESVGRAISLLTDKERDVARLAETLKLTLAQRLLPSYKGEMRERDLTYDEAHWMELNGIAVPKTIREVIPTQKAGKIAVVESIRMSDDIKMLLRSGKPSDIDVYRLGRDQLQYESLAAAGVRAVESRGVLMSDCMMGVDTNSDAKAFPCARLVRAKESGQSLTEVSNEIDARIALAAARGSSAESNTYKPGLIVSGSQAELQEAA